MLGMNEKSTFSFDIDSGSVLSPITTELSPRASIPVYQISCPQGLGIATGESFTATSGLMAGDFDKCPNPGSFTTDVGL